MLLHLHFKIIISVSDKNLVMALPLGSYNTTMTLCVCVLWWYSNFDFEKLHVEVWRKPFATFLWYIPETSDQTISVFSRTGYAIFYFNCSVIWVCKMQTEISLSIVEAEYVALSQAMMRDMIAFLDNSEELDAVFDQVTETPIIYFKLFEDNNRSLELTMPQKYC